MRNVGSNHSCPLPENFLTLCSSGGLDGFFSAHFCHRDLSLTCPHERYQFLRSTRRKVKDFSSLLPKNLHMIPGYREDGSPCDPDYLRKWVLYPAMDRAGIKRGSRTHGFHLFRHTAGSIVHEKTGSVKLAQKHLGHARLDTTANTYVHVDDGQSREAAEAVADAIQPFCPLVAHSEPIEAGQIQ